MEKMASNRSTDSGTQNGIGQFCINFMRIVTLWLCALVGIEVVRKGCRQIPAGHLNFDPDMAKAFGGRDGVARAIIFQHIANWITFNQLTGRNFKEGRTWSYNSGGNWAKSLGLWTQETVENHIRFLREAGLLDSKAMNAHKGDQTLWYSLPAGAEKAPAEKDSHATQQISLWGGEKNPVGGEKDSIDSSISQTANPISTIQNTKQQHQPRAGAHLAAGGVAQFPKRDQDPKEFSEPKPETRDASMESQDGDDERATPPPVPPAPSPAVPAWMPSFFTGCAESELLQILHEFGEELLKAAKVYAEGQGRHIDNPPGFVRVQLAKGWRPPMGQTKPREWSVRDYQPDLAQETDEYLTWVLSDECPFMLTFKNEARGILMARHGSAGVQ